MSTGIPTLRRNEPIARRPAPARPTSAAAAPQVKPAPPAKKERPEDVLTLRLRGEGRPAVVTMMNGLTIEGVILYVGRYSYLLRTAAGKEFEIQKINVCWVTAAESA